MFAWVANAYNAAKNFVVKAVDTVQKVVKVADYAEKAMTSETTSARSGGSMAQNYNEATDRLSESAN